MNLIDSVLVTRYNDAAPAKNRWGDTLCPQLPHISAQEILLGAEPVAK